MPISPFILIICVTALVLLSRSGREIVRSVRAGRAVRRSHGAIFIGISSFFCLVWCLFFIVGASLGHSADPVEDSWPQLVAGLILFLVLPVGFLYRQVVASRVRGNDDT
jgi:predicted branched-subunit amino acid permease